MCRNLVLSILLAILPFISNAMRLDIGWEEVEINDGMIEEFINSEPFQRLKKIDQSGPTRYFGFAPSITRYDHSIGVWYLAKKFGANKKEQVASLLHDVSHTAFSHLAEVIFEHKDHSKSYQDKIHLDYINASGIIKIAEKYGIKIEELNPDNQEYKILERPLPDLCSDRLQYNLYTALKLNLLSKNDIKNILSHIQYKDKKWYFDDLEYAKKFANIPLYLNRNFWNSQENNVIYHYFAKAIKRAVDLKIIDIEDFKFGTDDQILSKLYASNDIVINEILSICSEVENYFKLAKDEKYSSLYFKIKFRGIDPLVCLNGKCERLSELDQDFKTNFDALKEWCNTGMNIKIKKI